MRFLATERTPRKYGRASRERLRRVAAAALVQCHRSRLPEISGVEPWDRLPALLAAAAGEAGDRFFLHPTAEGQRRLGETLVASLEAVIAERKPSSGAREVIPAQGD